MSENWSVQVSVKTPAGTLINLRGETPEQVENQIGWVIGHADKIVQAEQAFAGVANVAAAAGGRVVEQQSQSWSQQGSQQAPPQFAQQQAAPAAPAGAAKKCVHGDMVYRSGNKNGRDWQAYFCPTPKGTPNQCQPEFVR